MIHIKAQQILVKFNKNDAGTLLYIMRPWFVNMLKNLKYWACFYIYNV